MKILLKRMHKNVNRNKVDKFMTDLGVTAFYNKPDKEDRDGVKQEKRIEEKEQAQKECMDKGISIRKISTNTGLLSEGTNTI